MRDFTLRKYELLLTNLQVKGYEFITFEDYCKSDKMSLPSKFIILRHDVDKRAWCSLKTAQIENKLHIRASYYFRVVKQSNKPQIIKEIVELGHEIGYHYEDMSLCEGDNSKAKLHFKEWLNYFRKFYPVKTICMHGAPQSKWDSKYIWNTCNYRDFGIIGEPYYDTDFSQIVYLTDTGRRWDGYKVSVRDKIPAYQELWNDEGYVYHTTDDIIKAIDAASFPKQVMITTHPQRWLDNYFLWFYELLRQNAVNVIKRILISR
ncbi:MAG: hypothetical protein IJ834_00915 [Paludibacteraceae bacterium]|nr:hypothetical protein [Paludibacteraceae bacterium]